MRPERAVTHPTGIPYFHSVGSINKFWWIGPAISAWMGQAQQASLSMNRGGQLTGRTWPRRPVPQTIAKNMKPVLVELNAGNQCDICCRLVRTGLDIFGIALWSPTSLLMLSEENRVAISLPCQFTPL